MASKSKPKAGSKAYYPRVRAKQFIPRFRSFVNESSVKVLNFYGYKAGMTHIFANNKHKGSPLNNKRIRIPVTIIEVPDMRLVGLRFYDAKKNALKDFLFKKYLSKYISKKNSSLKRGKDIDYKALEDFYSKNKEKISSLRLIVETSPFDAALPKKASELIELHLSGSLEEQMSFFKERLGKTISYEDFISEGSFIDVKAVTKGKGFQGVIKRFGVKRRHHKSEKGVRKVGSIGPWHPPLIMHTVPMPGQMGFHTRTVYNLKLLKALPSLNKSFSHYGAVKTKVFILAGSVPGPAKRPVAMRSAIRPFKDIKYDVSDIDLGDMQ